MNPIIFNQADPRWGGLPYRTAPYTVKSEGCGLCAVTHCAIEMPQFWNYTPKDTIGFMRTYATNGNGTEWLGIDKGLDKYIGNHKRHYSMKPFWDEVSKGNRVGIILFGSNIAPDGTQWTKGGHYVAFVDYKYEKGQHWLYMKDSSYRHLDGWRSYERSMRGCIPDVLWTAVLPNQLTVEAVKKWQKWMGVEVDGIISNQLTRLKGNFPAFVNVCQFATRPKFGSATVLATQRYLNAHKYSAGEEDGFMGQHFISSLQRFLNKQGFDCGKPDGIAGPKTANALKGFLYSF